MRPRSFGRDPETNIVQLDWRVWISSIVAHACSHKVHYLLRHFACIVTVLLLVVPSLIEDTDRSRVHL
jgi:hypothetical protein